MNRICATLLLTFLGLYGCASTTMYDTHGFLTEYGEKQTMAEYMAIAVQCDSNYEDYSSEHINCLRQWIRLDLRYDHALADLTGEFLDIAYAIAIDHESGRISKKEATDAIKGLYEDWDHVESLMLEKYYRVVATSRARDDYERRQRIGMALNQVGRDLMNQSSGDDFENVTCTEVGNGVVECEKW